MRFRFTTQALTQYNDWRESDAKVLARINALLDAIRNDPFRGIGKPEPLRGELTGFWSRRINWEHRIVYRVSGSDGDRVCEVIQCRFHY